MAATSYRYLVNLPGVCQGETIVEGTRIGVHDVVGLIINGANVEDVCRSFPDLSRAQVYECLAYLVAEQMREEIPWGAGGRVIVLNFPFRQTSPKRDISSRPHRLL